jgi:hypothetical protein
VVLLVAVLLLKLVVDARLLVLLVLGDQIVLIRLGLGELHLVHALARVPVQIRLASEHCRERLAHTLEQLLNARVVANKRRRHCHVARRHVADARLHTRTHTHARLVTPTTTNHNHTDLHVVGDPFDKVLAVLGLNELHLVLDLARRHLSAEHGGGGQVATLARIGGGHHVLRVEHLRRQLSHRRLVIHRCATCLSQHDTRTMSARVGWPRASERASYRQRRKADEEKVETREWHEIDGQFAQIRVELTREAEAAGHARHHLRHLRRRFSSKKHWRTNYV